MAWRPKFPDQVPESPAADGCVVAFKLPALPPEANIQAELYARLRAEGIFCLLEYRLQSGERMDCVVTNRAQDRVVCFLEVKRALKLDAPGRKQIERYRKHGIPVIPVCSLGSVEDAIEKVKALLPPGECEERRDLDDVEIERLARQNIFSDVVQRLIREIRWLREQLKRERAMRVCVRQLLQEEARRAFGMRAHN